MHFSTTLGKSQRNPADNVFIKKTGVLIFKGVGGTIATAEKLKARRLRSRNLPLRTTTLKKTRQELQGRGGGATFTQEAAVSLQDCEPSLTCAALTFCWVLSLKFRAPALSCSVYWLIFLCLFPCQSPCWSLSKLIKLLIHRSLSLSVGTSALPSICSPLAPPWPPPPPPPPFSLFLWVQRENQAQLLSGDTWLYLLCRETFTCQSSHRRAGTICVRLNQGSIVHEDSESRHAQRGVCPAAHRGTQSRRLKHARVLLCTSQKEKCSTFRWALFNCAAFNTWQGEEMVAPTWRTSLCSSSGQKKASDVSVEESGQESEEGFRRHRAK